MKFFWSPLFIVAASLTLANSAKPTESLNETINYLIDYISHSDAAFVRNGSLHTGREAAEHVRMKYDHFKNGITTPEDFIRLSASKSLLSGKPYLVRLTNGNEMRLDAWLTDALRQYRSERHW